MSEKRPIFFYLLRTQYENLGDLVINRECLRLLRDHGDVRVLASDAPDSFVDRLHLSYGERCLSVGRFFRTLILTAIWNRGLVYMVLVPGGFSGGLSRLHFLREVILVAGYSMLATMGVRIIRLGASIGPYSAGRLRFERWKSRAMFRIGLRDPLSIAYAYQHHIANVCDFPDFAFMLPRRAKVCDDALPRSAPYVVVSMRGDEKLETQTEELVSALSTFLDKIDEDCRFTVVVAAQVTFDDEFGAALAKRLATSRAVTVLPSSTSESTLFDTYADAACVLSNRLHVLLFALRCGVPIWALVHPDRNQKIVGLFRGIELEDRVVDISSPAGINNVAFADATSSNALFDRKRAAAIKVFQEQIVGRTVFSDREVRL